MCLNISNGTKASIFNRDIFKVLAEHTISSYLHKSLKHTVRENIRQGKAVSVEMPLLTNREIRGDIGLRTNRGVEERHVGHWTPLKNEDGVTKWVVLTIAPK
jgi:hypothetical protein